MEHSPTPDEMARAIAEQVSLALLSAGISQRTAASETGIPLTTLSRRLTGMSPFLVTELAAIAKLLATDVASLVTTSDKWPASAA